MSQHSNSSSEALSAVEEKQGKRYPAFVVKPREEGRPFSVCYAQFTFGIGSGDNFSEAMENAEYVLACGLHLMADDNEPLPDPVELEKAKQLSQSILEKLHLLPCEVDWVEVEVKPEVIQDEDWSPTASDA